MREPSISQMPSSDMYGKSSQAINEQRRMLVEQARQRWSDGRLRTDEELIAELIRELGFRRRGARIDARLRLILDQNRKRRKKP